MTMPVYLRIATALSVLAGGYCLWDDFMHAPAELARPAVVQSMPVSPGPKPSAAALRQDRLSVPEVDLFPDQRIVHAPEPEPPPVVHAPMPVQPPALPFRISGVWVEGQQRKIIVTDGSKNIIICRQCDHDALLTEGDLLNVNYRIDDINDAYLTLTYLPLQIKQVIRLEKAMADTGF